MSKIYEALLRAELERSVSTARSGGESASVVEEVRMPVEEFVPVKLPSRVSARISPEIADPDLAFDDYRTTPLASALDLSTVAQRAWHPLLPSLPALGDRGSEVEQFRNLRSHLSEFRDQGPMRSILVSSGLPGEGKSFVALNLALSFARHKGNRVLLIDGDMRRSSLHRLLGAPREPGLAEYLSGDAQLLEVMQRPQGNGTPLLSPGLASLTFIGGGKDGDKAGDLASNARFGELMSVAAATFDWIIVDSSPVNLVSDAVSLSHACDGVLLVGREGVTKYKTAQQAQLQFKSANVLGFVLNAMRKLPPKSDYYGSYDSYKAEG